MYGTCEVIRPRAMDRSMAQTLDQAHLRVLEMAVVPPLPVAPEAISLPLTFFDITWLNFPPVERVFFYRLNPGSGYDMAAILSNLKGSLSQALGTFYPLAGRLRLTPGTTDRHELHYQPGDGVPFAIAELDADVEELASDEPREVVRMLPLVPPLRSTSTEGAVLAVQATVLRGPGLAVGVAVHHAACDGASSTHFLHTWAWAAAGDGTRAPPPAPVMDRTLVKDTSGLYELVSATKAKVVSVNMADDQLLANFTLSKEDIRGIKDAVAGCANAARPRCSSLVATFSLVWSCYQRAKDEEDEEGRSGDLETYFMFQVDQRSRMKPDPIPGEYFGNCIRSTIHGAPMDRLAEEGAGGLLAACTAVSAAIELAVAEDGSREMMVCTRERMGEGCCMPVAGSPRFRVYDVDFGFGRPAKVEIVSVARTGAMAVAESRRSSGGMEVGISLPPAAIRRFQKCFHDAITWLHQRQH